MPKGTFYSVEKARISAAVSPVQQVSVVGEPVRVNINSVLIPEGIQVNVTAWSAGTIPISINVADIEGAIPISIRAEDIEGIIPISINADNIEGSIPISINASEIVGNISICIADVAGGVTIPVSGSVTITGTPSVSISGTPSVNITGTPNINIASISGGVTIPVTGSVTISGTPSVSISGTPSVSVTGTPNINIASISGGVTIPVTGSVNISGTPNINIASVSSGVTMTVTGSVSISGTPSVTITGTPSVYITGTPNINIYGQSVAIKTQGEWAPQAGQQKYLSSGLTGADIGANTAATIFNYAVTSGKTFYITYASFMAWDMATGTPAGLPVGMDIADYDPSTGNIVRLVFLGGNGGGGISFPTPVKVAGGHQIYVHGFNPCEMTLRFLASFGGYEL